MLKATQNGLDDSVYDVNNNEDECIEISSCESIRLISEFMDTLMNSNTITAADGLELTSLYESYMDVIRELLISLATKDKNDIERAHKTIDSHLRLCDKNRKTGLMLTVLSYVKTPNYHRYSDVESHSELLYAYGIIFYAMICALETHNIFGLIKIAINLQKFIRTLKVCKFIYKRKIQWASTPSQQTFESGYKLATSMAHIFISYMPPKLLRIINLIGVSGVYSIGFNQLNKVAFTSTNMQGQMCKMVLILFWTFVEAHFSLTAKNVDICQQLLNKSIDNKSGVYFVFKAKLAQISGNIDESINIHKKLITDYESDIFVKYFWFELMLSNAMKCDVNESIKYALLVRKGMTHSPAFTTYCEAVFRYLKGTDESDTRELERAVQLLGIVPSIRVRYFGKSLTVEKMAVMSAQKFSNTSQCSVLPDMDLLYQLNCLSFIAGNTVLLDRFMDRIGRELDKYANDLKTSEYLDNYLTALFYKGVIHRLLSQYTEARNCLKIVFKEEARFGREYSIPPQSVMELGLVELELNNRAEAEKWLKKSLHDYSNYMNENYVHIRAYAALRELGVSSDKHSVDQIQCQEYRNQWLRDTRNDEENVDKIQANEKEINA